MDIEDDKLKSETLIVDNGEINFNNINFSHEGRDKLFSDFNLTINSGDHLCLVGESGAGKSTLASMLVKFFEPQDGVILINEMDLSKSTYSSIRKNIGIVMQKTLIFAGTIRMYMALANRNATESDMLEAFDKAAIGDFVRSLPDGLDTELSNGGNELSGEQRQRISIARVYLKNPKIIIFDESTSSLDNESESMIRDALDMLGANKTGVAE